MKTIYLLLITALLATAGCAGKSKAELRKEKAHLNRQQQALAAQMALEATQPAVWFRGLVRKSRVPWFEEMTLAQGLIAAEYTGAFDPTSIKLTRQGQTYSINPKRLLRGQENPVLEPGDLVDVTR